jgi:hypothetical protein
MTVIPRFDILREQLRLILANKRDQGHVTDGLEAELEGLPQSYDAMAVFGRKLTTLPLRPDWPHVEPNDLAGIWAECDPTRPLGVIRPVELGDRDRKSVV